MLLLLLSVAVGLLLAADLCAAGAATSAARSTLCLAEITQRPPTHQILPSRKGLLWTGCKLALVAKISKSYLLIENVEFQQQNARYLELLRGSDGPDQNQENLIKLITVSSLLIIIAICSVAIVVILIKRRRLAAHNKNNRRYANGGLL